ncbi:hypothetical protein BDZ45DRAFT_748297 [Acephala macrosclerotiorum]|nr:hypothetical protein BDZ45DRAFT_748297 [Acephala macrosclerotiorum]
MLARVDRVPTVTSNTFSVTVAYTKSRLKVNLRHGRHFDDTVVGQLRNITKSNVGDDHEFTLSSIKAKLVRSQDLGSEQLLANQILAKGSSCFRNFVAEHRDAFKEAISTYSDMFQPGEKRKQVQRPVMSKTLEGGSATRTPDSVMHPGNEEQLHDTKARTENGPATSRCFGKPVPQAKSSHSTKSTAERPKSDEETAHRPNTTSASQKIAKITSTQMSNTQRPSDQLAPQIERLQAVLKQKDVQIGILRAQWQAEAEAAHTRESRLKAMEANIRAENSLLEVAQQEREQAGKDPLESTLFKKNHDIWDLTQRLMKMQKLHSFAGRDALHKVSIEHGVVDEALDRIADDLEFMLNGHDLTQPLMVPKIEENGDLGCLVRSIFGQGNLESSADRTTRLKQSAAKFGAGPVLRAFCVSAIGEWVFNSNFPNFVPNNVRLLQAYREAVMAHDGWTRLRNIELAAYNKLINEDHFQQKIVPKKAEDLAVRLSRALAPFFPADVNGTQQEGFETWGEAKIVWADRRFRMTEIFEGALRLKAATITTDQIFDFVVNMPGSTKRNPAMDFQVANTGSMPMTNIQAQDDFYELASFHIHPGKASVPRDLMADALVQSRNFIDKAIFTRSGTPLYTKCIRIKNLDSVPSPEELAVDLDNEGLNDENRLSLSDGERQASQPAKALSPVSTSPVTSAQKNDDDLPFKCQVCQRGFKVKRSLTKHKKDNECSQCLECSIFFAEPVDLRRHQKIEHAQQSSGKDDEKRGKRKASIFTVNDSDAFDHSHECDDLSDSHLSPRKKIKTNQHAKNYVCSECDRVFYHGKALEKHMLSDHVTIIKDSPKSANTAVHGGRSRRNTGDGKEAPAKDSLGNSATQKKHEQDIHSPHDPKDNFKCPVCPKVLYSVLGRDDHFNSHPLCLQTGTGHVPNQTKLTPDKAEATCQVCGKRLVRKLETQVGKDTRTNERPTSRQRHVLDNGGDASVIEQRNASASIF